MIDYIISGITEDADFTVYTGTTPYNGVLYGYYTVGTTSVTIFDVPYNKKFYVIFENNVTKFKTYKLVKTDSAYCQTGICDAIFTLEATNVPTPTIAVTPSNSATPTVTPTHTPTPSITPSKRVVVTPTPTNSLTPTRTPTVTPTISLTPSTSPTINCGYYEISYSNTDNYFFGNIEISYTDCNGQGQIFYLSNFSSFYVCVYENNGIPQITIQSGFESYVTINRISNCAL